MIEVTNLTKRYGHFTALDAITFRAAEGEILGFLGPNGAGKTTTMRILTGYMPPTAGSAQVAGCDVLTDSLGVRRRVGYLPENVPLYRDMTVRGYLMFAAELRAVERPQQRVAAVLDQVGMTDRARSLIRNLSKGMRQRVGLAQAMVHDPAVLILDEPTIGLDPHQVQDLRGLIRDLGRAHTVMFSTHILSEAEQICDRVVIIDRGHIVAENTPAGLQASLHRGGRLFVRVEGRAAPDAVVKLLRGVPKVTSVAPHADGYTVTARPDADVRAALAAAVVGQGLQLVELRPYAMTLEDIFMELTTRLDRAPGRSGERPHA